MDAQHDQVYMFGLHHIIKLVKFCIKDFMHYVQHHLRLYLYLIYSFLLLRGHINAHKLLFCPQALTTTATYIVLIVQVFWVQGAT